MDSITNLYKLYKRYYEETGKKEHPSMLLALLLLPKKQDFVCGFPCEEGKFYKENKSIIDKAIQQVEEDFHFTKADYAKLITAQNGSFEENEYEENKIWFCYAEGFGCVHWWLMYHSSEHETTIYRECFQNQSLILKNLPRITNILSLNYEEFKFITTGQDYFRDAEEYLEQHIKITLTNVELNTLRDCGNLTVLRQGDTPIEITLVGKEEMPKQIVKNQKN